MWYKYETAVILIMKMITVGLILEILLVVAYGVG